MDEYYDYDDASEWKLVLLHFDFKNEPGIQLDAWIDARNTKKRYQNQLRNFSRVYLTPT